MIKLNVYITENGQRLLLSISYHCYTSEGIASYNGIVESSVEPLAPFDPTLSGSCVFSFCRDAYWNALCNPEVIEMQGYATDSLRDILLTVAQAIMEYEEKGN